MGRRLLRIRLLIKFASAAAQPLEGSSKCSLARVDRYYSYGSGPSSRVRCVVRRSPCRI